MPSPDTSQSKLEDGLLFRFSLYGFLKNQTYFEPFFLLVLRGHGLSFFEIGLLFSFRQLCVNLFGIPAGFAADLFGRRRSLLICFGAYIVSFLLFALTSHRLTLVLAMFAFSVGESFRAGTHKAIILHYLRLTGREAEKTAVYGRTRSFSKLGGALSALLSGVLVFLTGSYPSAFLFSIPPYLVNALNVGSYPKVLEGEFGPRPFSLRELLAIGWSESRTCLGNLPLRYLFFESALLQAVVKSSRDYVQPLMVAALAEISWVVATEQHQAGRGAMLTLGLLYFMLNLGAAAASRSAERFEHLERRRWPILWLVVAFLGGMLALGPTGSASQGGLVSLALGGFVGLVLLENLFRPVFLDRLDELSDTNFGAAVLSVEAQVTSLGIMLLAPAVGWLADHFGVAGLGGLVVSLAALGAWLRTKRMGAG